MRRIFQTIFFFSSVALASTTSVTMDSNLRIKAKISRDSMNRIAVVGDRITQVFGDLEAYEIQTEETTGQIFIKPNLENGDKPLSITLITENAMTQDLLLEPTVKEASTLILKCSVSHAPTDSSAHNPHEKMLPTQNDGYTNLSPYQRFYGNKTLSFQEQLIDLMKKLVSSDAPAVVEDQTPSRSSKCGIDVQYVRSHSLSPYKGQVFTIANNTDKAIELKEDEWFEEGNLALSFESPMLKKNATTTLYVVSK